MSQRHDLRPRRGPSHDARMSAHAAGSETAEERDRRNLGDLLQELRVAGLGVQVLFGFLLAMPFTVRFKELNAAQVRLYDASLLMAALSIGFLVAPVAFHRWVFRMHEKAAVLRAANAMSLIGLLTVAIAVLCSVSLVMTFVAPPSVAAAVIASCVVAVIATWFVLPIRLRLRNRSSAADHFDG